MIAITPSLYAPGAGGAPDQSYPLLSVRPWLQTYEHTIVATQGFEGATITLRAPLHVGLYWLQQLGAGVWVYGPGGFVVWEGRLVGAEVRVGGETRGLVLDGTISRVKCRYTGSFGTPLATAAVSNASAISRYGVRDGVLSLASATASDAATTAAVYLAAYANPIQTGATTIGADSGSDSEIVLTCAGWYSALGEVFTVRADTAAEAVTTQVAYLLAAYNATNAFFSTDMTQIAASGVTAPRTIDADTPYRTKIEALLARGDGANRYAWGVYENQRFRANVWAGADATTIAYRQPLGTGRVYDAVGNRVPGHTVRPDALYEVPQFVDTSRATFSDTVSRYYAERVTYSVDSSGERVTLEPAQSRAIDARLARFQ